MLVRRELKKLVNHALAYCAARGHDMGVFEPLGVMSLMSACRTCRGEAVVTLHPPDNGVQIGGLAVWRNCSEGC